jgi:hypothetical protein
VQQELLQLVWLELLLKGLQLQQLLLYQTLPPCLLLLQQLPAALALHQLALQLLLQAHRCLYCCHCQPVRLAQPEQQLQQQQQHCCQTQQRLRLQEQQLVLQPPNPHQVPSP